MEGLMVYEVPKLKQPVLIAAFAGWPDAAEAATRAVRYLVKKLSARKFADLDPEAFYDFTQVRPLTRIDEQGQRVLRWPSNEFFYSKAEESPRHLLLLVGTEPNLKWRAFTNVIMELAKQNGVAMAVTLGALLDAVPHTREARISGSANQPDLAKKLENLGVYSSGYQGPTGITAVLTEAYTRSGIPYTTMWGHSPHYLHTVSNPRVTYGLVTKLTQFLGLRISLEDLHYAATSFEKELEQAVAGEPGLYAYVKRLEQEYDEKATSWGTIPSPDVLLKDLEDFLRRQREQQDKGEAS